MYFPVGWPKQLRVVDDGSVLVHITASYDRLLHAILTERTLSIWFAKPSVEIVSFRRSETSITEFGNNELARWRADSSRIAVSTTHGTIIFYRVEIDKTNPTQTLFNQREERGQDDQIDVQCIPALVITELSYIQIPGGCTSLICLRDDLLVATGRGLLQRLHWSDGQVNSEMTIELASVPFSTDLQQSRSSQLSCPNVHLVALHFSPLLGGFAVVFSNGKAAFITASSLKFEPTQVVGVWAQEMTEATAAAINHKYALMAYGCRSGEGSVYHLDEVTGALVISHRLIISCKDFPDAGQVCGAVTKMKWTPDGSALAMAWSKGGFSVWSVFGSLLLHSMGVEAGMNSGEMTSKHSLLRVKSMEWGCEGYRLWMIGERQQNDDVNSQNTSKPTLSQSLVTEESCGGSSNLNSPSGDVPPATTTPVNKPRLLKLYFVKSSLTVNPCMSNHEHLLLQGEDRLYLNPEDGLPQLSNPTVLQPACNSSPSAFVGNKQWHIMHIPHTYLAHNWPLKFAAMSLAGHCVVVAGKCGLAHYSLVSRKWKLFGNETQERDMMVTGGLTWWKDYVCCACFNLPDQRSEIRLYPRDSKLDNTFAHIVHATSQILLLNTFRDLIVVLCADCHIVIYEVERKSVQNSSTISLHKLQEIAIGSYVPHPSNIVALSLTSLRTDSGSSAKVPVNSKEVESVLINVAGRLLMFQRDRSTSLGKQVETKDRRLIFTAPVIVASSVESMWLYTHTSTVKPHLTEALWLGCGASGIKVWLPLQPKDEGGVKSKGFLSRRIMLPFNVDIYPLAMLFEAGIILGANSEAVSYPTLNGTVDEQWPYLQLERTSQVYLHHILRQLLRRNLGVHALEVARSCTDLPYFPHVLELLVHEVLEEEATSKEPIPDALLPRVVAFVEEFPEYLQTIAHCARKSDVAVWNYFFTVVGNPIDLFQECLMSNKLDTAASYLIILQNLEKPVMARQHATMLLDCALENCTWDLARDLVRFLTAIDPSTDSTTGSSTRRIRQNSATIFPIHKPAPVSPEDSEPFRYGSAAAVARARSITKDDMSSKDISKIKDKVKTFIRSDSISGNNNKSRHPSNTSGVLGDHHKDTDISPDKINIEAILNRHARKLLTAYKLYDLAFFAANLEDYQLVRWLRKERLHSAKVDDFISALKKLHDDFRWPLPILSLCALRRLSSVTSLESPMNSSGGDMEKKMNRLTVLDTHSSSSISDNARSTDPVALPLEDSSLAATDHSETGSFVCDIESMDSWTDLQSINDLEQMSLELMNRGPEQSDIQLRYLFQLLVEAGCLEWAALITLVLRDAALFLRIVNIASMSDTPSEIVVRLRNGLTAIETWANNDCVGYRPFFQLIASHIGLLQNIDITTAASSTPAATVQRRPSLSKCPSADSGTSSVGPLSSAGLDGDTGKRGGSGSDEQFVEKGLKSGSNIVVVPDETTVESTSSGCLVS